jgi:hypothetical protein
MHKLTIAAAISLAFSAAALADTTATSNTTSTASGTQQQGNYQGLTIENPPIPPDTKITVKSVPNVAAPAMTTTLTETCMGSISGGVSVLGIGATLGTTYTDDNCVNRLNSREVYGQGYKDAAREVLCQNPVVREAFKNTNNPCFLDRPRQGAAAPVSNATQHVVKIWPTEIAN